VVALTGIVALVALGIIALFKVSTGPEAAVVASIATGIGTVVGAVFGIKTGQKSRDKADQAHANALKEADSAHAAAIAKANGGEARAQESYAFERDKVEYLAAEVKDPTVLKHATEYAAKEADRRRQRGYPRANDVTQP
jgi:uncharacterized membrane protein YccC